MSSSESSSVGIPRYPIHDWDFMSDIVCRSSPANAANLCHSLCMLVSEEDITLTGMTTSQIRVAQINPREPFKKRVSLQKMLELYNVVSCDFSSLLEATEQFAWLGAFTSVPYESGCVLTIDFEDFEEQRNAGFNLFITNYSSEPIQITTNTVVGSIHPVPHRRLKRLMKTFLPDALAEVSRENIIGEWDCVEYQALSGLVSFLLDRDLSVNFIQMYEKVNDLICQLIEWIIRSSNNAARDDNASIKGFL